MGALQGLMARCSLAGAGQAAWRPSVGASVRCFAAEATAPAEGEGEVVEATGPPARPENLQMSPYRRMLQLERKRLTKLRRWALNQHQRDTLVRTFEARMEHHQNLWEWREANKEKDARKKTRLHKHETILCKQLVFRERIRQVANAKRLAMKRAKALAKEEFLEALREDVDLWETYPNEMEDRRYRLLREKRPYYTRFN